MLVLLLPGNAAADATQQNTQLERQRQRSYKPTEPSYQRASYLVMGHALGLRY